MRDFFSILREKTGREPGEGFDRRFWARFDAEFSGQKQQAQAWSLFTFFQRHRLQLVAMTAAIAIASVLWLNQMKSDPFHAGVDPGLLLSWNEMEEIEPDFEMFDTLDDVALSDSDWQILLEGKS